MNNDKFKVVIIGEEKHTLFRQYILTYMAIVQKYDYSTKQKQAKDQEHRNNQFKQIGRVGKTSVLVRYCQGKYKDNSEETVNAFCLPKEIQVNDSQSVNITIWDTAGQEKYKALAPMFYQEAVCAVIVYDITIKESFDKVKQWVNELNKILDINKIILCIAGNKCDLQKERQIENDEAESYAYYVGAKHFLTSAKSNKGIDELFLYIGQEILKRNINKGRKKTERLVICNQSFQESNQRKEEEKKKRTCC